MAEPRLQSNMGFGLMSLAFRLRDMVRPPAKILAETNLQPGMTMLDFGCGPGGFSLAAARLVGPGGRVYAVDIHSLAVRSVRRAAAKQGLDNVQTIQGNSLAKLGAQSVDIILLYDVLHDLPEPKLTLRELYRVLEPEGLLSVSDHHLPGEAIRTAISADGYFRFTGSGRWTHRFKPATTSGDAFPFTTCDAAGGPPSASAPGRRRPTWPVFPAPERRSR